LPYAIAKGCRHAVTKFSENVATSSGCTQPWAIYRRWSSNPCMLGKWPNPFCSSGQRKGFSPLPGQNCTPDYTEAKMAVFEWIEVGTTRIDVTPPSDSARRLTTTMHMALRRRNPELLPSAAGSAGWGVRLMNMRSRDLETKTINRPPKRWPPQRRKI
jgi:hypothetical protein